MAASPSHAGKGLGWGRRYTALPSTPGSHPSAVSSGPACSSGELPAAASPVYPGRTCPAEGGSIMPHSPSVISCHLLWTDHLPPPQPQGAASLPEGGLPRGPHTLGLPARAAASFCRPPPLGCFGPCSLPLLKHPPPPRGPATNHTLSRPLSPSPAE